MMRRIRAILSLLNAGFIPIDYNVYTNYNIMIRVDENGQAIKENIV